MGSLYPIRGNLQATLSKGGTISFENDSKRSIPPGQYEIANAVVFVTRNNRLHGYKYLTVWSPEDSFSAYDLASSFSDLEINVKKSYTSFKLPSSSIEYLKLKSCKLTILLNTDHLEIWKPAELKEMKSSVLPGLREYGLEKIVY